MRAIKMNLNSVTIQYYHINTLTVRGVEQAPLVNAARGRNPSAY